MRFGRRAVPRKVARAPVDRPPRPAVGPVRAAADFNGQIEFEALRLYGLPEDAVAVLYRCPSRPAETRTLVVETSWDLPSLGPGGDGQRRRHGARRSAFADASLDTGSIAFVLDCHVSSNSSVRVTARNVSTSTVDLAAAPLAVQVSKARIA